MKKRIHSYLATTFMMWQLGEHQDDPRYALQWMRYQGRFEGAKEIANALGYRVVIRDKIVCLERVKSKKKKEVNNGKIADV